MDIILNSITKFDFMDRRVIVTSEYFHKIFRKIRFPFSFIAGSAQFYIQL